MDSIMDKISQKLSDAEAATAPKSSAPENTVKLTANDLIRANTMADAQEKERLRAEVAEYKACLDRLSEIADSDSKITEVIDAVTAKIDEIQYSEDNMVIKEALHKEGVRVYKNVQAVVAEEVNKVKEDTAYRINAVSGKITAVLAVSIISLGVSVATVAFLALSYLGIF